MSDNKTENSPSGVRGKTLALIHTSATLVPIFAELCSKHLPGVKVFNIVDDSLIKNTIACGELTKSTSKRVVNYAASAEEAGADFILYTCSSIGPAVEAAAALTEVPVLRVDQPMADLAIQSGKRIGVIATLSTTLEPTSDLVRRRAIVAGKEVEIKAVLCEGAFEALMSGDAASHDKKVGDALKQLVNEVDVIVLAQASMGRVVDTLDESDKKIPILASPGIAIEYLKPCSQTYNGLTDFTDLHRCKSAGIRAKMRKIMHNTLPGISHTLCDKMSQHRKLICANLCHL